MLAPAEMPASTPSRGDQACSLQGVLVADRDRLVDHRAVEHLGDEAGADPLDLVRPRRAAGEHRRGGGLDGDDEGLGRALPEHPPDAGDRPARADPGDEGADLAVGVPPDLLGGRAPVDLGVGRVRELLRHEALALLADLLGQLDRLAHPPQRGRLAHLGAVGAQQLRPLAAHPLRAG